MEILISIESLLNLRTTFPNHLIRKIIGYAPEVLAELIISNAEIKWSNRTHQINQPLNPACYSLNTDMILITELFLRWRILGETE